MHRKVGSPTAKLAFGNYNRVTRDSDSGFHLNEPNNFTSAHYGDVVVRSEVAFRNMHYIETLRARIEFRESFDNKQLPYDTVLATHNRVKIRRQRARNTLRHDERNPVNDFASTKTPQPFLLLRLGQSLHPISV